MPPQFDVIADNLGYFLWGAWPDGPLGGVALTLVMSVTAGALSLVIGTAAGVLVVAAWRPLRWVLRFAFGFLRVIPPLLVIFWLYFLMPVLFGVDIPPVETAVVALTLLSTAYIAVSTRAGILAVPRGQWQAGQSLGLTPIQTLCHVILPQALRIMLPSFVNQFIALIKDTSLAYVIGVTELTYVASQINNRTIVYPADIYCFVGGVYFVLCFSLNLGANRLSQRLRIRATGKA